ncbi:MAG: YggT family protein [Candidatus Moranbacteria bacterium]|nr:YggT family protein [Candidatus Moranbacteria bacterium]
MSLGVFRTVEYLVNFLFGVLEALLLFRLVLRFAGANAGSGFVRFIYGVTAQFVTPFEGIFRSWLNRGVETTSVLEPATIVAIFVYAVVAWGIVRLIRILAGGR